MNEDMDKLDDLFRKGLEDPVDNASYREADWDSLDQRLDKQKKRRGFIYWLPVLSSAAALLLFFGWWAFRPKQAQRTQSQKPNITANHIQPANPVKEKQDAPQLQTSGGKTVVKQSLPDQQVPASPDLAKNHDQTVKTGRNKPSAPALTDIAKNRDQKMKPGESRLLLVKNAPRIDEKGSFNQPKEITDNATGEVLAAVNGIPGFNEGLITATPINNLNIPRPPLDKAAIAAKNKIKMNKAFRPQFALTVLAAPDISGVGSFQQSKLGTNFGLLFTGDIVRKLSISTGVIYSDKPYLTTFENYHTKYKFPTNPENVSADCRMLDIPVNLGYRVYHKNLNTVSFSTGLSSYIMVDQAYQFNYSDPYAVAPKKFDVSGNDKYIFEILNLSATYQRQLNSKVSLSVQPYFKLPLANIGYSEVRLQTTGVAVGITWNLNSLSKQ